MLSLTERYCYICELSIKTVFDRFQPPAAADLFSELNGILRRGSEIYREFGDKRVSISEIQQHADHVVVLFRLTNPDIPDNTLENQNDSSLRVLARNEGEIPAVSAHLVVRTLDAYVTTAAYPAIVENVDYLSRSLMVGVINGALAEHLTETRPFDDSGTLREYSPRVEFRGHPSQTLESVLNNGGRLGGLHMVTSSVTEQDFGDDAYPVKKTAEIHLAVKNKPHGSQAINWLRDKVRAGQNDGLESARVVIEDPSGRSKTSKLDLKREDIASNFFILQARVSGFAVNLETCEETVREDMVQKMLTHMPD